MDKKTLKDLLMDEIKKDEHEYCFDKSYHDDKTWEKEFPGQTREQRYQECIALYEKKSAGEIMTDFGSKYEYVVDMYNKQK